jgi:hypothetical protein
MMRITLIIYTPSTMSYHRCDGHTYTESNHEVIHGDSEEDFERLAKAWADADTDAEVTVLVDGIPVDDLYETDELFLAKEHYRDSLNDRRNAIRKERHDAAEAKTRAAKAEADRKASEAAEAAKKAREASDRATYEALRKRFE